MSLSNHEEKHVEAKEKYISLSHHRNNGDGICNYKDTIFLSLDEEVKKVDEEETINFTDLETGDDLHFGFSNEKPPISPLRPGSPKLNQENKKIENESSYDNFYGVKPRYHRITLYETNLRFYLVASVRDKSVYNIMKINRDAPIDTLSIDIDPTDYSTTELNQLLNMINEGNSKKLQKVASGHGLLGFIRFTRGYYLIMITQKEKRGSIGPHQIYSVCKTGYVYIPRKTEKKKDQKSESSRENRYKALFFNLDFKEFYFSYSYDLTNTLQHNITSKLKPQYNRRFAWNHYLMKPLLSYGKDTNQWLYPLIHGYFGQNSLSQYGKIFKMSIIARRSRYFAGTRYLKRGVNNQGRVANDVETEQIVEDCNFGVLQSIDNFSAFVQIRGSIPLFWGQEPRTLTPKPPIFLHNCDPLYAATKLHFRDLFTRFGYPIVVLNLVKKKEKKERETILRRELEKAINEINDPLPSKYKLKYISWDFSRAAKSESENVVTQMTSIAEEAINSTGYFHSGKRLYINELIRDPINHDAVSRYDESKNYKLQIGVLRSNCIDSLDRTNAAQFIVGKVAMGYQLYSLGVIGNPEIDYDGKLGETLMYLYQNMGNTLALQYGGSELAHTMKTYQNNENKRLGNPRDMYTSFRRYYSNSFMDYEKQDKINIFLGNYKPWNETTDLWDLETDYYLHMKDPSYSEKMMLFEKWWKSSAQEFFRKKSQKICLKKSLRLSFENTRLLQLEAYNLTTLTLFDKICQRDTTIELDKYPSATKARTYYGRGNHNWITIFPSTSSKNAASTIISDWDPEEYALPDFEIAKQQREFQAIINGPEHNLLSYYHIFLVVQDKTLEIYANYAYFSENLITIITKPQQKQQHKEIMLSRVNSYTGFHEMNTLKKIPLLKPQGSPVVKKSILRNTIDDDNQNRGSTPNPKITKSNLKDIRRSNRLKKLYTIEYDINRITYDEFFTKIQFDSIISDSNPLYRDKFIEYRSKQAVNVMIGTDSSHVSKKSYDKYSQFVKKQLE